MICAVKPVNVAWRSRKLRSAYETSMRWIADRAALAFKRQAAFGGVVGAVFRSDRRVEHERDATAEILVHECNDALRDADHVCGHADAAVAVCVERVLEILCDGKIGSGVLSASLDGWLKNGMDVVIGRCMVGSFR